jgi:hypothetical protein
MGSQWMTLDEAELRYERVSYGYCPACAAKAFEELDRTFPTPTLTPAACTPAS